MSYDPLSRLIELGYGTAGDGELHPSLGPLLWAFNDAELDLKVFRHGFLLGASSDSPHAVRFSESFRVQSSLTVQRMAQASQNFTGHERLPMHICNADGEQIELSVPMRFYSTLLQALVALSRPTPDSPPQAPRG